MKRILIAFTALAAFFTACDTGPIENALDDFKLVIGLEPINTNASVLVYDAVTNDLVPADVTVTIGGQNGDQVIDIFSDPVDTLEFEGGVFNFGLNNNFVPSESNPATVALTFNAPGYLESVIEMQLADTGLTDMEVEMIPLNALPDNITQTTNVTPVDEDGNPLFPSTLAPAEAGKFRNDEINNWWDIFFDIKIISISPIQIGTRDPFWTQFYEPSVGGISSVSYAAANFAQNRVVQKINTGGTIEGLTSIPTIDGNNYLPSLQIKSELFDKNGNRVIGFTNSETEGDYAEQWAYLGRLSIISGLTTFQEILTGNGYHVKSKQANYANATAEAITRHNITVNSLDDLMSNADFNALLSATDMSPKLLVVTVVGNDNPYVYFGQSGEVFEHQTFAIKYDNKNINFGITITLGTENVDYTLRLQSLGRVTQIRKSKTVNLNPSANFNVSVPNIDASFIYSAEVPWGTYIENFNPTSVNTVSLTVPAQPSNLTTGTVEVSLKCANGAAGVSLSNLPATPIQYRKSGTTERWRQAVVNWNYDSVDRVLKGGSFSATAENGVDYAFQISVDGNIYPTDGPEIRSINFVNGKMTFEFEIDNDDFCQK